LEELYRKQMEVQQEREDQLAAMLRLKSDL